MVEVSCGEYGPEYIDRMVQLVDNGKCHSWTPQISEQGKAESYHSVLNEQLEEEIDPEYLRSRSSSWEQFRILYSRRTIQMCRDSVQWFEMLAMRAKIILNTTINFTELPEAEDIYEHLSGGHGKWSVPRRRQWCYQGTV